MGHSFSLLGWEGLRSLFFSNKESKLIMVGLDAAGKTTILFNLKLNEGTLKEDYNDAKRMYLNWSLNSITYLNKKSIESSCKHDSNDRLQC